MIIMLLATIRKHFKITTTQQIITKLISNKYKKKCMTI